MSDVIEKIKALDKAGCLLGQDWQTQPSQWPTAAASDFVIADIRYHSSRGPEREASRIAGQIIQSKKRHAILLGCGYGFLLPELLKSNLESIAVIEPDLSLISHIINKVDVSSSTQRLSLFFLKDIVKETLEPLLSFLQGKNVDDIYIYSFHPAFQAKPSLYLPLQHALKDLIEKRSINQATIIKFQHLWNRNLILNSNIIIASGKLNTFLQANKVHNVVIAGAGPSLYHSTSELKAYREKYILIAADTALVPLAKSGVIPDIVIAADPQWHNHFFAQHHSAKKPIWFLDPVVHYMITRQLKAVGSTMVFWDNPFVIDKILRTETGSRGEISHGGSVSTNAFDLALQLKAKKIIFVGQDLSFTKKMAHTKGAILEDQIFIKNSRLYTFENHNLKQLTALPKIWLEDLAGKKTFTNAKMKVFIDWFEKQAAKYADNKNVELFNASVSGVNLAGFKRASLDRVFHNCDDEKSLLMPELDAASSLLNRRASTMPNTMAQIFDDLKSIEKIYQELLKLAKQLGKSNNSQKTDLHRKLQKQQSALAKFKKANDIAALEAQAIILKITEFEKESSDSDEVALYRAMIDASKNIQYLLKKLT